MVLHCEITPVANVGLMKYDEPEYSQDEPEKPLKSLKGASLKGSSIRIQIIFSMAYQCWLKGNIMTDFNGVVNVKCSARQNKVSKAKARMVYLIARCLRLA